MARIPQETIDRIHDTADILDVVSRHVDLKKRGRNFFGLCPFHNEKTPSFSVAPDKGIYHCLMWEWCGSGEFYYGVCTNQCFGSEPGIGRSNWRSRCIYRQRGVKRDFFPFIYDSPNCRVII